MAGTSRREPGIDVQAVNEWTAEDVNDATAEVEAAAAELTLVGALDEERWWVRLRAT